MKVPSCLTAFGREQRWAHLTTPQHLRCALVGLINSGFVGISLVKGEKKQQRNSGYQLTFHSSLCVQFKRSLLGEDSLKLPQSELTISYFVFPEPLLMAVLDMIIQIWSWFSWLFPPPPPGSILLRTELYYLSFSPEMTPSDFYSRHSHLLDWVELLPLYSWVWIMDNLLVVSLWVNYWTSWDLSFLIYRLGGGESVIKSTANEHECLLCSTHSTVATSRLTSTMRYILW